MIKLKRIYEKPERGDGFRILVDRLWPRGLSKEKAALDLWFKDLAPSHELRKWFDHDPQKWPEFQKRYKKEIAGNREALKELRRIVKPRKNTTLLYAAKDEVHNEAVIIKSLL